MTSQQNEDSTVRRLEQQIEMLRNQRVTDQTIIAQQTKRIAELERAMEAAGEFHLTDLDEQTARLRAERDAMKQDAIEVRDTITILRAQLGIWRRFCEGHILNDAVHHHPYWRGKLDVIKDVVKVLDEDAHAPDSGEQRGG
jgi:hypothetical protein